MDDIDGFLRKREEEGLLRGLKPGGLRRQGGTVWFGGRACVDFSSNDYLGLSSHPRVIAAAKQALEEYGASSSASRLLSGDLEIHHRLEGKTAAFKGKEAALVFNSGYQANVGIISALCGKGDCIFSDRLNHASLVDGILLSGAAFFRFRHNDMEHLQALLGKERGKFGRALIVTETIFSMDGDEAPLKEIVRLKQKFGCDLMVDEAHATGLFGDCGGGIVEREGLEPEVDIIMGTFSKALGGFGGYAAASRRMISYFINACRAFIYSTALPPAVIAANLEAIDVVRDEPLRRAQVLSHASAFRGMLEVSGASQIVPFVVGDAAKAVRLAEALREKGHWVLAVRPPTVPHASSRLRFSVTFHHDMNTLRQVAYDLRQVGFLVDAARV